MLVENLFFINYLSSLILQATISLGEMEHPITKQRQKNLGQAKILIDTLGVLATKTKGNLTDQEAEFLTVSLAHLQEQYEIAMDTV